MVISSLIRYLLSDNDSLLDYEKSKVPSFNDVKRRLLLLKRQENKVIPDHYYRLNLQYSFNSIDSLGSLIRKGLYRLADEHLELRANRIYVKQEKQNNWQELITYIPPLILQMAFLHIKKPINSFSTEDITKYYFDIILPNTKHTSLPHPYIPQIRSYIEEKNGFMDLHIHLNGSTEVDIVWNNILTNPYQVIQDIEEKKNDSLVKEQLEQESFLRTPKELLTLLISARQIREYFFNLIYYPKNNCFKSCDSVKEVLDKLLNSSNSYLSLGFSAFNPFASLIYDDYKDIKYPMAVEGLMYILVFRYIAKEERESTSSIFHYYILILGLFNRLLVQQRHQRGFQQFQKLTLNNLRENSERQYKDRFLQIYGNDKGNISFVEGRFSPKDNSSENIKLIESIYKGWESLKKSIIYDINSNSRELPQLKLIAHFIKKRDNKFSTDVRHKELRYSVWKKARVLSLLKKEKNELINNLVGIDAASSEFDTPPEVFAPAFRYLKRNGFNHFTYHAGEDFYHLIGGMRAIFEAIEFNELSIGDRIGHATAIGLSPKLWLKNVGDVLLVRQGEYLDDLLFVYHLIISNKNEILKNKIPFLIYRIQELSYIIYRRSFSIDTQVEAWLMRKYCPVLMFSTSQEEAEKYDCFDQDEWNVINSKIHSNHIDERVTLLMNYHSIKFREEYNKIIEIDTEEFFSANELELLQLTLLLILHKKEIVIETLPTSNVRIGHHNNYDTYHLWNWIRWEKEGKCIPPIVLGTDDTGIFATNIYNEYANIYCNLVSSKKMGHNEAMEVVKRLDNNARIYKFN